MVRNIRNHKVFEERTINEATPIVKEIYATKVKEGIGIVTVETIAYKLLSNSEELNSLLDKLRGKKFGLGFKQGIFTYDIPERPTNALSKELAPFMRIYPTYENDVEFADDKAISTEHRITINYWCLNAKQSEQIAELMDKIFKKVNGFLSV